MNEKLPKYVEPVINRVGTKYHYFRYKGKRLGALPGAPYSTEFMKAYYDFLAAVEGKAPLPTAKPKKVNQSRRRLSVKPLLARSFVPIASRANMLP